MLRSFSHGIAKAIAIVTPPRGADGAEKDGEEKGEEGVWEAEALGFEGLAATAKTLYGKKGWRGEDESEGESDGDRDGEREGENGNADIPGSQSFVDAAAEAEAIRISQTAKGGGSEVENCGLGAVTRGEKKAAAKAKIGSQEAEKVSTRGSQASGRPPSGSPCGRPASGSQAGRPASGSQAGRLADDGVRRGPEIRAVAKFAEGEATTESGEVGFVTCHEGKTDTSLENNMSVDKVATAAGASRGTDSFVTRRRGRSQKSVFAETEVEFELEVQVGPEVQVEVEMEGKADEDEKRSSDLQGTSDGQTEDEGEGDDVVLNEGDADDLDTPDAVAKGGVSKRGNYGASVRKGAGASSLVVSPERPAVNINISGGKEDSGPAQGATGKLQTGSAMQAARISSLDRAVASEASPGAKGRRADLRKMGVLFSKTLDEEGDALEKEREASEKGSGKDGGDGENCSPEDLLLSLSAPQDNSDALVGGVDVVVDKSPLHQGSLLFTVKGGNDVLNPMLFFLGMSVGDRPDFARNIEANGGKITTKVGNSNDARPTYHLLDAESSVPSGVQNVYKDSYITECLHVGKKLDVEAYRFGHSRPNQSRREEASPDDSIRTASLKPTRRKKIGGNGRVNYTADEDIVIMEYVRRKGESGFKVGNRVLWREFVSEKLLGRAVSVESLRGRLKLLMKRGTYVDFFQSSGHRKQLVSTNKSVKRARSRGTEEVNSDSASGSAGLTLPFRQPGKSSAEGRGEGRGGYVQKVDCSRGGRVRSSKRTQNMAKEGSAEEGDELPLKKKRTDNDQVEFSARREGHASAKKATKRARSSPIAPSLRRKKASTGFRSDTSRATDSSDGEANANRLEKIENDETLYARQVFASRSRSNITSRGDSGTKVSSVVKAAADEEAESVGKRVEEDAPKPSARKERPASVKVGKVAKPPSHPEVDAAVVEAVQELANDCGVSQRRAFRFLRASGGDLEVARYALHKDAS